MKTMPNLIIYSNLNAIIFIATCLISCKAQTQNSTELSNEFGAYWFSGKAELTAYALKQARYGELHKGEAVLIFVTEDFSKKKQVKLNNPQNNPQDAIKVLKLNKTRTFNTGIYQYNMMLSSFVPIDQKKHPFPLKINNSSQDWCGQTFSQLNLLKNNYTHQLLSYFESEGDNTQTLQLLPTEDGLWQQIRLNPNKLPQGKFQIIPGLEYARLRHLPLEGKQATGIIQKKQNITTYALLYNSISRKLIITFQTDFPHKI